jgi:immune inhibitor A
MKAKWFSTLLVVTMLVVAIVPLAGAAPASAQGGPDDVPNVGANTDNPSHPLGDQQAAEKQIALEAKLAGKTKGKTHEVAKGQYVELAREGEDSIWTVVAQFGNTINPAYGGTAGPQRNQIPQPDRTVDNSTIWAPDFNQPYYQNLLFSDAPGAVSMRNFYIEQSSNRYTVNGTVEDWVTVPFNEANYGSNYCGGIVCARTWLFVRDSVNAWYNAQIAAGKTPAEISAYLAKFDVWDRYDYDGDGNFNEPDGYIDHFQAIHAGEGEETGGGAQGTDAIWSHRWYAYYNNIGFTGPAPDNLQGGIQIGGTNFWIGDYTVEPENGGVGVFSHEFGHDLGLPDLYDTSGNTGGAENSTGFWTLYSSGSYGASGKPADGIGSKPIPMSAYEKIFLGWSNYQTVGFGQKASVKLGPANYNTKQAQQLVVLLPDKEVSTSVGAPYAGQYQYFSGAGNELDNTMTRQVTLPAGAVILSAKIRYDAELDFDYGYLTVNGAPINTSLSSGTDPNGNNPSGFGITGSTGGSWADLTADLSAFAGQTVTLGFEYKTDPAVAETGFFYDEISITGQPTDGAETDPGWTYNGFSRVNDTVTQSFFNAYFAEFRTYLGYDDGLRTGPYNFGFLDNPNLQNWVEHFPYQSGLLVWYYDTSFPDNNVGDNCASGRCGGLYLPVDAHPDLLIRPDNGKVWRPRIQSYDSTFGLNKTDKICLNANSIKQCYGGLPANPKFDDTKSYWVAPNAAIGNFGWASVPLPGTGTTIRVVSVSAQNTFMQVQVNK